MDCFLTKFVSFEPPAVQKFHEAVKLFKEDIPELTKTIHQIINDAKARNAEYGEFVG